MAKKTTAAASRSKAKTERLELPLNKPADVTAKAPAPTKNPIPEKKPAAAKAPVKPPVRKPAVRKPAVEAKPSTDKTAKPADLPVEPTPAVKKVARKAVSESAPQASLAGNPAPRSIPIAGGTDLVSEGRAAIATFETCGAIAAKGAESLGKEVVSFTHGSVQAQFALTEALMNAKTLQDALTAQGAFARESLGNMTEGFAKLTGMSLELTQTFMAPIQARVSDTARSIWRPGA